MAIEALYSGLDVVEVLRCATIEAERLPGVIDPVRIDMAARPKVVPRRTPRRATSSTWPTTAPR
jgi:hypothetical protein